MANQFNPINTLEKIRLEMAKIRKQHSEQTKLYILAKTRYDVKSTSYILTIEGKFSMAEKERKAKKEFVQDYMEYKTAKAEAEYYDREFRNLDAQRSILQTRIANIPKPLPLGSTEFNKPVVKHYEESK
jgi:hypothetical protein